jgi:hypothetical protein
MLSQHSSVRRVKALLYIVPLCLIGCMSTKLWSVTAQEISSCLAKPEFNQVFVDLNGGSAIPLEGSCCQKDVCNLPCPAVSPKPGVGYGIGVGVTIIVSCICGFMTYVLVGNESENYFVAGHSLPIWIVAVTLGAAAVDSNSLLGNVDLAYKFSFYDGAGTYHIYCTVVTIIILFSSSSITASTTLHLTKKFNDFSNRSNSSFTNWFRSIIDQQCVVFSSQDQPRKNCINTDRCLFKAIWQNC